MSVAPRRLVEAAIAQTAIMGLLDAGFYLTVDCGEGLEIVDSRDLHAVLAKMNATDEDIILAATSPDNTAESWLRLVYGNSGPEVMSDMTRDLGGYTGRAEKGRHYTGPLAKAAELADAIDDLNYATIDRLWPRPFYGMGEKVAPLAGAATAGEPGTIR